MRKLRFNLRGGRPSASRGSGPPPLVAAAGAVKLDVGAGCFPPRGRAEGATDPGFWPEDEAPREGELREQDRFLPIYNISKVMKKVVPHSGKVAKEARECVQECVSEFISFITR